MRWKWAKVLMNSEYQTPIQILLYDYMKTGLN